MGKYLLSRHELKLEGTMSEKQGELRKHDVCVLLLKDKLPRNLAAQKSPIYYLILCRLESGFISSECFTKLQ